MSTKRICDICGKEIPVFNQKLQDVIDQEYLGKDVCPICDGNIKLNQALIRDSIISNSSPQDVLREMAKNYGIDV